MFSCSRNTGTVEHSQMFVWTKPKLTVSHGPACPVRCRLARQCQPEWDFGWVQTCLLPLSRNSRIPADPYGPAHGSPLPSFSVNTHTDTHRTLRHDAHQNAEQLLYWIHQFFSHTVRFFFFSDSPAMKRCFSFISLFEVDHWFRIAGSLSGLISAADSFR